MALNDSRARRRSQWILSVTLRLLIGTTTSAQGVNTEVFGGMALWGPTQDALHDATYAPTHVSSIATLFENPDPRSIARQSLAVETTRELAAGLGMNLLGNSR